MELGRYGNTPAAHRLVQILNDLGTPKMVKTIGNLLRQYNIGVSEILKTDRITQTLLIDWRDKYITTLLNHNLPKSIETYTCNVIAGRYKKELRIIKDHQAQEKLDNQKITHSMLKKQNFHRVIIIDQNFVKYIKDDMVIHIGESNIPILYKKQGDELKFIAGVEYWKDIKKYWPTITDNDLIKRGFIYNEKDSFTGKPIWKHKDQIVVNPGLGLEDSIYSYIPTEYRFISNATGHMYATTIFTIIELDEIIDKDRNLRKIYN